MRRNNGEREAIEQMKQEGWTVYTRGWPDLLCVKDGVVRLIEVKPHTHLRLSKHQAELFAVLAQAGLHVEIHSAKMTGVIPKPLTAVKHDRNPSPGYLSVMRARGRVTINKHGDRLHVSAPFTEEFRQGAHTLGGRYRNKSKIWSFKMSVATQVMEMVKLVYGEETIKLLA